MFPQKIVISGGAGFIGSHLAKYLVDRYPNSSVTVIDALTYAGDLYNLKEIETRGNFHFVKSDIAFRKEVEKELTAMAPDWFFHLAAESHVDRSIDCSADFVSTNVVGTVNLLEILKNLWKKSGELEKKLFYHVSTDEVYGSLPLRPKKKKFTETTPYDPQSPYSASKASSDHFVRAYAHTYGMPVIISNCSNNYGPNQYPEKLIPVVIFSILEEKPIPVYGKGENVRDWIFVEDHVKAIDLLARGAPRGQTYNIGGMSEMSNIELIKKICAMMDKIRPRKQGKSEELIHFVKDRPGHDLRYAIDNEKIRRTIDWKPERSLEDGLKTTIEWYIAHRERLRAKAK